MKDAKGHGSNKKPIPGSSYHTKTNDQLRYILKDASEAERATRGMSMYNPNSGKREDTAGKYSDQVNDAATVLAYRDRGGKSDAPADQLHSGTPKSDPAPVHDSMAGGHGSDWGTGPAVQSSPQDAWSRTPGGDRSYETLNGRKVATDRPTKIGSGI